MDNTEPVAHIHAQHASHDEAWLVGNRVALERIHARLGQLLAGHGSKDANKAEALGVGLWAHDGEGYTLIMILDEDETRWDKALLGYTADYMQPGSDADVLHPSGRVSTEVYLAEHLRGVNDLSGKTPPST